MKYTVPYDENVEDIVIDRDGSFLVVAVDDLPPNNYGGCIFTKFSPSFEVLNRKAYVH